MVPKHIKKRTLKEAFCYTTDPLATMRSTAKDCNTAKSTVHTDLNFWLPQIYGYGQLKKEVKEKIEKNTQEKSARGGEAIRKKYLCMKQY